MNEQDEKTLDELLAGLTITADNYDAYNVEPVAPVATFRPEWRRAMDAHGELGNLLDAVLPADRIDWAGQYAAWLDNRGIASNSDNGWWSREALNHNSIRAFVAEMRGEVPHPHDPRVVAGQVEAEDPTTLRRDLRTITDHWFTLRRERDELLNRLVAAEKVITNARWVVESRGGDTEYEDEPTMATVDVDQLLWLVGAIEKYDAALASTKGGDA